MSGVHLQQRLKIGRAEVHIGGRLATETRKIKEKIIAQITFAQKKRGNGIERVCMKK
jgi:hypothetical protein